MKEKNLQLERLVFFSDAVVAIAITLLALDLRLDKTSVINILSFKDIGNLWIKFSAFILSFILIAVFWRVHHQFFIYIKKIDEKLMSYNLYWLFFIVMLPFSSTLVSSYFGQTVSIFVYSINTLLITFFQNAIWDYACIRPDYLNNKADKTLIYYYRLDCNIAMINALIAVGMSFLSPITAMIILFVRPILMNVSRRFFRMKERDAKEE